MQEICGKLDAIYKSSQTHQRSNNKELNFSAKMRTRLARILSIPLRASKVSRVHHKSKMAGQIADDYCILVRRCKSDLSCCGVVLDSDNGIVLTVASLIADLFPGIGRRRPFSANCSLLSQDDFAATSLSGRIAVEVVVQRSKQKAFTALQGYMVLLWRDEGLQRIAERIFPSSEWKFESLIPASSNQLKSNDLMGGEATEAATKQQQDEARTHQSVLSDFVLIHVENLKEYLSCKPLNLSTFSSCGESPNKGDRVLVVGTPFGCECPPVFYNSVSKGIVSNLIGDNNELIITDARCIPGCEGCTMYIESSQPGAMKHGFMPHGVILAPFCWRNGEWIGITVACSLGYLLQNLRKLVITKFRVIPQNLQVLLSVLNLKTMLQCTDEVEKEIQARNSFVMHSHQGNLSACNILETAFASVVMVHCGTTWGSGIVIDADEGLLVTCSHVIRGHEASVMMTDNKSSTRYFSRMTQDRVFCVLPNGLSRMAQVLYATSEGFPLDFALLKIQPHSSLRSLKPRLGADFTEEKPDNLTNPFYRKGEELFVVGFPLFSRHQHTQPSVVSGVISNIVYANNQAVLLQSSAAVHCGSSGGALVSMVTGELVGMVTSHTKDANLSSSFPHVNFSIPVDLLCKLVSAIKSGGVEEGLRALVSDHMESIWKLESTVRKSPQITSKL